jgi:hypothetical protein
MKKVFFASCLFFCFCKVYSQPNTQKFSVSNTPQIFLPGIISNGLDNRDMAISPSNDELYFTLQHKSGSTILFCKKQSDGWSKPKVAWFSGKFSDLEPAFSPDGNKLFFTSNRPLAENDTTTKDYDIWYFQKKSAKWTGPFRLDTLINTNKNEYYPSIAANGNLYFTRDNGETKEDLFVSNYSNGKYEPATALPSEINSEGYEFNAFIDPAEKFIIFSSYGRKDDLGGGDLYISKKKGNVWQQAIHMETPFNSADLDYCPFVSFDKKFFFFTSKRSAIKFPFKEQKKIFELERFFLSYGNGSDDIYVVSTEAIEHLLH